jgi:hypothetical protein
MFILPFIHEIIIQRQLTVHTIKVLTVGGQDIWEEADNLKINKDILNPNDIYAKSKPVRFDKALRLCAVDTNRTPVSDFYRWNELSSSESDIFCWRTFTYIVSDNDGWLAIPSIEKLGRYSIRDIIRTIIEKK